MSFEQANTVQAGRYQISGDRLGQVTVKEIASGEVIRTFEMDEEVVVREVFLLDGGRTVAASQKDHAVFWDLATGQEVHRFQQRIYGFSHNETKFFTYKYSNGVSMYAYPELTRICLLLQKRTFGPGGFLESLDDRFLAIRFGTGFPSSDKNYPRRDPCRAGITYTKLFNIESYQEIQEFSNLRISRLGRLGEFSLDSRFYDIKEGWFSSSTDSGFSTKSWRFDLTSYKVSELVE